MKKLAWKKGFFSSKYELSQSGEKIGDFSQSAFSRSSRGDINGTRIKFKTKGVFNSETEITDLETNETLGKVKFNTWGNKAVITLGEKNKYKWKYDNFWGTKWAISKDTERLITYNSSTADGEIESSSDSDVLLLSGFFIHNHYLTILIVIAVSTVIIASR